MHQTTVLRTRGAAAFLCALFPFASVGQAPTLKASLAHSVQAHRGDGRQVAFSPDAQILATSGIDSTVKLWRVSDAKLIRMLRHPAGVTAISFSPDGSLLASSSYDGAVRIWRLSDGAVVRTLTGHSGTVWSVAFSPDGKRIASSGEDKTVRLWRASDGKATNTMRGHTLNVWCVAFSPDGQLLGSSSFDKTIKLWRVETGALVRTLTGSKEAVVHIDFSPEGELLASGGDDTLIRLWRVSDGTVARVLSGSDHVYAVAFSHDGKWLASGGRARGDLATLWQQFFGNRLLGGDGKTIRLWRTSDGALQQELRGHANDVWAVALSRDGNWLASSDEDGKVNIWRLRSGQIG